MTSERNFDRLARAWLELGPDEAPDRVIAAVLQAAETAPQTRRRIRALPWRSSTMPRAQLAAGIAAIAIVVAGAVYLLTRADTVGPPATPSPPTASLPASPSAASTSSAEPLAVADVVLGKAQVFAWEDTAQSIVVYQALAEIRNEGSGWARLSNRPGSFEILDASGNASPSSPFTRAVPSYLGPGATGYLLDSTTAPQRTVDYFSGITAAIAPSDYSSVEAQPGGFEVTDITWRAAGDRPGLLASGTVTNQSAKLLPFAVVAVLCIGSGGEVLGYSVVTIEDLTLDEPTTFEATNATPPLQPADCVSAQGFVGEGVEQN